MNVRKIDTLSLPFALPDTNALTQIRDRFAATGRVEIPAFLSTEASDLLRRHLLDREDWVHVVNGGEKVYEIPRSAYAAMDPDQKAQLVKRIEDAAQNSFQYWYESVRVPDDAQARAQRNSLLDQFVMFMSSRPVLDFLGQIVGDDALDFADGQATAYSHRHFLTRHDDNVTGKNRRAAYVLGLAPNWRAEWGGLLMFHGADGNIEEAFVPAMGALRLFTVPTVHSVSYVTPSAPEARLSVTGWLRAQGAVE